MRVPIVFLLAFCCLLLAMGVSAGPAAADLRLELTELRTIAELDGSTIMVLLGTPGWLRIGNAAPWAVYWDVVFRVWPSGFVEQLSNWGDMPPANVLRVLP